MGQVAQAIQITVSEDAAGGRLDAVLAAAADGLSRARVQALLKAGAVTLTGAADGRTIEDASRRVKRGEVYLIKVPEAVAADPVAQAIPLDVRYEDAHLIVIDKPAGLVVHPAAGNPDRTLVNALLAHCGDSLSGIGGVRRPGIVHRLDKDTSGLMVAAKTDAAHTVLTGMFAARDIERAYLAIAWGAMRQGSGEIEGAIGRSPRNRKKMAVVSRGGKPALTRWSLREAFGSLASLVECRLATGRTHQIRVHLAHAGHPLIGDPLYGRKPKSPREPGMQAGWQAATGFPRQALHAAVLGFRHPVTGEMLSLQADPPADFASLLATLQATGRIMY